LNPSLNRWGFTLREVDEGDFSIRNIRQNTTPLIIKDTGNVGIGTTSPGRKLTVQGADDATMQLRLMGTASQNSYWEIGREALSTGQFRFIASRSGTVITPMVIDDQTGNVGIGTTSPAYKLDVFGSGRFQFRNDSNEIMDLAVLTEPSGLSKSKLSFLWYGNETASIKYVRGANSTGGEIEFWTQPEGGSIAERMTILSNGNVGIGTTSPGDKLQVDGTIWAKPTSNGALGTALKLGVFTDSASTAAYEFKTNDSTDDFLGLYSNRWGINYEIHRDSSTGDKYVWAVYGDDGGHNMQLYNGSNTNSVRLSSFSSSWLNGGNVGIGTTSPSYKLDVAGGDVRFVAAASTDALVRIIAANYATEYDARLFLGENDTNGMTIEYDGSNNVGFIGMNSSTDPTGAYSKRIRMSRDGSEVSFPVGNVGIGTTSPTRKLSVVGDVSISNNSFLALLDTAGNNGFTLKNTTANLAEIRQSNSGTLKLWAGFTSNSNNVISFNVGAGTEVARITNDGNVGIGTTSPAARLHIGESGAPAQLWLQRTDGYNPVKLIGGTLADGNGFKITMNTTDAFAITSGGNVGIGVTPSAWSVVTPTLQIGAGGAFIGGQGSANVVRVGVNTYYDGSVWRYINTGSASWFETASGAFGWFNAASGTAGGVATIGNLMTLTAGGNLGIGTTSPTNKLHVNGGSIFNQDGFLYMSNQFPIVWGAAVSIEGDNVAGTLTLKTESSHRIFINNVGNVGVGTTSPTNRLTVTTATNAVDVLRLNNTGGDSGSVQGVTHLAINHFNSGTNPSTRITAYQDSTSGWPGGMYFSTRSLNTDSAPVERMRITSGGNVGIGTTSPQYMLDVNGDAQINAQGTGPAYAYVPDGGFGLDSLITSGVENVALGKPDVWLRIHVDGVAFVFPGYQEP
jgi:hypothetical protein